MPVLLSSRERQSLVWTIAPDTGWGSLGIMTWTILSAGGAVRKFVCLHPGCKSAAKTTTAETVKVRKAEVSSHLAHWVWKRSTSRNTWNFFVVTTLTCRGTVSGMQREQLVWSTVFPLFVDSTLSLCASVCPGGLESPCSNHGNCDDGLTGSGRCRCYDGFKGRACELCLSGHYGPNCTGRPKTRNHGVLEPKLEVRLDSLLYSPEARISISHSFK